MTAEEIYKIAQDEYGWRKLPDGNKIKLGNGCKLGNWCTLGDWCKLGDGCKLGNGCTLGDWCTLGNGCTLGYGCKLGNGCTLGDWCKLGDWYTLGARVTCNNSPLQIQGPGFLVYPSSKNEIGIGCEIHTYDYWCEHGQQIADDHGVKIEDYRPYVDIVRDWLANNWS